MEAYEIARGALDAAWMARFERICLDWFAAMDERISDPKEVAATPRLRMIGKQSGIPLTIFRDATQAPAEADEFLPQIAASPIWPRVATGEPLYLLRDYCSVRRQKPEENQKALGWHQDSAVVVGASNGGGVRGYVAWVPITPIDTETPTLQLIPGWNDEIEHKINRTNSYLEAVTEPSGEVVTLTDIERGDIVLFDLKCPHRTHVAPGMTKDRLSVDLRLVRERPERYVGDMLQLAG
jgi:Phytanoyl-CoA dioxygenase (PhyH)